MKRAQSFDIPHRHVFLCVLCHFIILPKHMLTAQYNPYVRCVRAIHIGSVAVRNEPDPSDHTIRAALV